MKDGHGNAGEWLLTPREKILAYSAFAIVCTVWGTTYLAIRVAIETLPVFLFPALRFVPAGLILLSFCLAKGDPLPKLRSEWANLFMIGVLMVGAGNLAVVYAEHHVSSGMAALLVATSPFWMAALETLRPEGERVDLRIVVGMLIGFAGVAILIAPEIQPGSYNRNFLLGVLALQAGSICWNIGSIRSKYHPPKTTPLMSASLQMLFGGVVLGLIGLARGEISQVHFTTRTLLAFLYLLVFGSIMAYGAYVYALSKLRTSTVSLYAYINPVVAVVLGWAILDERFGLRDVMAMVVIFAGVALVQSARRKSSIVPAPAEALEKV